MYDLNFSFPFTKVDQSRRIVTGVATADNIDPSGDIVDFDASMEAFDDWMGNIREMHQPKSVGKAVDYKPVKVPYQGHIYDGFEVSAYISKGAEDTWQKVLDGTLRGFSIGGKTLNKAIGYDKNTNRRGQRVTKYFLGELSLVDNPGNPAALFSLIKRAEDGQSEYCLQKYDVYFCGKDNLAAIDVDTCPSCQQQMLSIGDVSEPDTQIVRKLAEDFVQDFVNYDYDLIKVVNSHKTAPKGYPSDSSQYADPANFKYPIDGEHIKAAIGYYNHNGQQSAGGYSDSQWSAIGSRIASAASRLLNNHYSLKNGQVVGEEKMEKLLNNNEGDNVTDMDLTPEQKQGVIKKFMDAVFGDKESIESVTSSPVVVNVNVGEEISKAVNSVPKAKDGATPAKSGKADAEDASDGGADEDEEDVNGEKMKKGTAGNTTKVKGGTATPEARPKTGPALEGAGSNISKKAGSTAAADAEDAEDGGIDDDEEDADGKKLKKSADGGEMDLDMFKEAMGSLLDEKLTAVKDEINASVDEKIEKIQSSVDETSEKIEKVENSGALKKSVDASEEEDDKLEKNAKPESFWAGAFVPFEVVEHLGYES